MASNRNANQVGGVSLRQAEAETRRLARSHYENFVVASLLLPRRLRQPFYNVYAFCRTADDLADESGCTQSATERLQAFQIQLNEAFAGKPAGNLFIALSNTIEQFQLPQQPFDDLIAAFRQDQVKTRYRDFTELLDYCRRSANPVGRILLKMVGSSDPTNDELSDQICTGLQLANFWQDVARDRELDRVYLPQDAMATFEVDERMLACPSTPEPLRRLLRSECRRAAAYFHRGLPLAERVPRWFARDVRLFAHGGLATLDAIAAIDYDVLRVRPTVSKGRQMLMVAKAAAGLL